MKTHCFFAHIAFARDARARATPQATVNLLIEINATALRSGGKKKHLNVPALVEPQRLELAKHEFRRFPVQRFVDFNLTDTPTYISICPPPTKVLPNDSKVWQLAESESDKLRTKPLPVLCGVTKRETDGSRSH